MNLLLQRVQDILLRPEATSPVIDAEPADAVAALQQRAAAKA